MGTLLVEDLKINVKQTKKATESILEKYKIYMLSEPEERQPKITASYSLLPPTKTNQFYSSTEDIAIKNIDFMRRKQKLIENVQKAINRLDEFERAIVVKRYLSGDDVYDYEVYNELGLSERKYYRMKAKMFYKLALILNVEVYD
ncbi:ArpU family phage packaging/lysis transcriptional regulator [Bacillus carboniphilus]|uniref:ArpU family phage packaging/lysis transcriptional regulator n=1 Tax=Bacillus carboniphilus TaxID=86663 RepID=A0ABY9JQK4_9BACI|nr:ArpU family phage packaging/lysis transcriptional regulator [Bacillus carboniphilus]WLR41679.1 ArpU family phage packaging/lysis transcriptional regulator [Bacillus carboniphilus]